MSTSASSVDFHVKKSGQRGWASHGWLKTYHHFPFAAYYDPSERFQDFGALRVINEDRVEPSEGFGTHGHSEFEIFSYIVSGELEHRDSLNNLEIMKRGEVQMTSTGTGIRHSEFNRNTEKEVHFLQIWAKPNKSRLPPKYYNRIFSDEEKLNKIVRIVAPIGDEGVLDEREAKGPIPVHADIRVAASILEPSKAVSHTTRKDTTKALIHNIMTSGYRSPKQQIIEGGSVLKIKSAGKEIELAEGDSVFVTGKLSEALTIENSGGRKGEFLIFEML